MLNFILFCKDFVKNNKKIPRCYKKEYSQGSFELIQDNKEIGSNKSTTLTTSSIVLNVSDFITVNLLKISDFNFSLTTNSNF